MQAGTRPSLFRRASLPAAALLIAVALISGAVDTAAAQPAEPASPRLSFAPVPDAALAKAVRRVSYGRGFNPANAAATGLGLPRTRLVALPGPAITAALRQPTPGSFEAFARAFREDASTDMSLAMLSLDLPSRRVAEGVFGAPQKTLARRSWTVFFGAALTLLGPASGNRVTAFFYNPVVDAAVVTVWEHADGAWRLASAATVAGERARGAAVAALPAWTAARDRPLAEVLATATRETAGRLSAGPIAAEDSTIDTALVVTRVIALQRSFAHILMKPGKEAPLDAIAQALLRGEAAPLRAAGLGSSDTRRFLAIPEELREELTPQAALATRTGAVYLFVSRQTPSVLMAAGISASGRTLVPVALDPQAGSRRP